MMDKETEKPEGRNSSIILDMIEKMSQEDSVEPSHILLPSSIIEPSSSQLPQDNRDSSHKTCVSDDKLN